MHNNGSSPPTHTLMLFTINYRLVVFVFKNRCQRCYFVNENTHEKLLLLL